MDWLRTYHVVGANTLTYADLICPESVVERPVVALYVAGKFLLPSETSLLECDGQYINCVFALKRLIQIYITERG